MILSNHFTLEEFTASQSGARSGLDNKPNPSQIAHLMAIAATLEKVRTLLGGAAIHIDSGYRSPAVNALVGGAPTSAHLDGYAADFICPTFGTPYDVACRIRDAKIPFDQLICEYGWVHISIAPTMRRECLTKKSAKEPYIMGLIP
jgi:hypothetical protein